MPSLRQQSRIQRHRDHALRHALRRLHADHINLLRGVTLLLHENNDLKEEIAELKRQEAFNLERWDNDMGAIKKSLYDQLSKSLAQNHNKNIKLIEEMFGRIKAFFVAKLFSSGPKPSIESVLPAQQTPA